MPWERGKMEKLKTLKELDESNGKTELWAHLAHIKMEAIKWARYARNIQKPETFNWEGCFKTFHNLTEEDLK